MTVAAQNGRMRWWYESIADWMISHPDRPLYECAAALSKSTSTISLIINSDVFKHYLLERRRSFREQHDATIIHKTTAIAEKALDLQLEVLETRRQGVPLSQLIQIGESALGRLGYGVKADGQGGVTVNVGGAQVVAIPRQVLAEARGTLRAAEQRVIDITPDKTNGHAASAVTSALNEKEVGASEVEATFTPAEVDDAPSP